MHYSINTRVNSSLEYVTVFLLSRSYDNDDNLFSPRIENIVKWCAEQITEEDWDIDLGDTANFRLLAIRTRHKKQQRMLRLYADLSDLQWCSLETLEQMEESDE